MKDRIESFVAAAQAKIEADYKKQFITLTPPRLEVSYGGRYAKIIKRESGQGGSVYCFIDLRNGDVLKAASWKAPAKIARGNINADDFGASAVGPYGANYLR